MSTAQRLYFYGLALASLEVAVWGVVGLLRTFLSGRLTGSVSLLAAGIFLVLVSLAAFLFHWRAVQREALGNPFERASQFRAVFLYTVLTAALIPILYGFLALLNRAFASLLGTQVDAAWFDTGQSALDYWLAIFVNAAVLAYFWFVLRIDWQASSVSKDELALPEIRRLYRYFWMVVGLTLFVTGIYHLLLYFFSLFGQDQSRDLAELARGAALALMGGPLWSYLWWLVQESLYDPAERGSRQRLAALYIIMLAAVVGVLSSVGAVLAAGIRWLLREVFSTGSFLYANRAELAVAIPLALLGIYYARILRREATAPHKPVVWRLFFYILAFLGLAVTLVGIYSLIEFFTQLAFSSDTLTNMRELASGALSALIVGFPMWLFSWRRVQTVPALPNGADASPSRSIIRSFFLYLVMFLLLVGAVVLSGWILYVLLSSLLAQTMSEEFGQMLAQLLLWLAVDVAFLGYHWQVLRNDNRVAQQVMGARHAALPTLVLVEEDLTFSAFLADELNRVAPRLPMAVHPVEHGVPDEALLAVKALVMSAGLAVEPTEALRLWLADYSGKRLLVPSLREKYTWLGFSEKSPQQLAREAAYALRQMAEGETRRPPLPANPWLAVGYIITGLFSVLLLLGLFLLMIAPITGPFQ